MSLQIVFLGTAGAIPTPARSLPAILIQREGEHLLFDCGEGVQRQMIQANVGFHKTTKIFITHMHGDHVLGIPGLLQTMALLDRQRPLHIYGPTGIQHFLDEIRESLQYTLPFPLAIHEIYKSGTICDEKEYVVQSTWANHVIPNLAYALVEKPRPGKFYPDKAKALGIPEGPLWGQLQQGCTLTLPAGRVVKSAAVTGPPRRGRKIVYTGDTRPCEALIVFATGADLLIHDSTFDTALQEKAENDGHSTPDQAAQTAEQAKVNQLILVHISARYEDATILLRQAQQTFQNTILAEDFLKIVLPLN
jgi:ribonuclease Z